MVAACAVGAIVTIVALGAVVALIAPNADRAVAALSTFCATDTVTARVALCVQRLA